VEGVAAASVPWAPSSFLYKLSVANQIWPLVSGQGSIVFVCERKRCFAIIHSAEAITGQARRTRPASGEN
jgi:hypothetical protein